MPSVQLAPGIVLTGAEQDHVALTSDTVRRSMADSFVGDEFAPEIDAALRQADFSIGVDIRIVPKDTGPGRRSLSGPSSDEPPELKVEVEPGESAVLLVQNADGVFHWHFPKSNKRFGEARRSASQDTLVFSLAQSSNVAPADGRRGIGDAIGWVGEKLVSPIRVRVLRYIAARAIDKAIDKIEGELAVGLVWLDGSSSQWQVTNKQPPAPIGNEKRVLLLIHGTFSTTAGSFIGMEAAGDRQGHFLAAAREKYSLILGFDHKTLALNPEQNAEQIYAAINFLPDGTIIDAVAYSRGGLVYRSLVEQVANKKQSKLVFDKVVFVGCTNSGTHLAEPRNWEDLVGLYTNIGLAGARGLSILGSPLAGRIAAETVKLLGGFVQALPVLAIGENQVPGLAAMEPSGPFVSKINAKPTALANYHAIISDFEPRPNHAKGLTGGIAGYLADRAMDRLMRRENDLVVHTSSMTSFGLGEVLPNARVRQFAPADAVYHTVYFQTAQALDWLAVWLLADEPKSEEAMLEPAPEDKREHIYVSGTYKTFVLSPMGPQNSNFTVVDNGDGTFSGKMEGGMGWMDVEDGKIDGNQLNWKMSMTVPMPMKLVCEATVEGDKIAGEVKAGAFGSMALTGEKVGPGDDLSFAPGRSDDEERRSGPSSRDFDLHDHDESDDPLIELGPKRATAGELPDDAEPAIGPIAALFFAAEMSATPKVGIAPMTVAISRQQLRVAAHAAAAVSNEAVDAHEGKDIQVTVIAMENCRAWAGQIGMEESGQGASVEVSVPVPEGSEILRFLVEGAKTGVAKIQVEVTQGPASLASFTLQPLFIDFDVSRLIVEQTSRPMQATAEYPVMLRIFEQNVPGVGLVIKYDLVSRNPSFVVKEDVTVQEKVDGFSIKKWSKDLIEAFNRQHNLSPDEYMVALRNLSAVSVNATKELLPEAIIEKLADHWDRVNAIQVYSENPHLPWELLSIKKKGARPGEASFLAEKGLLRWVFNAPPPNEALPVRDGHAFHVVPTYLNSEHNLKNAPKEKEMFETVFRGATSAGTTSTAVVDFLWDRGAECDVLHFTCHGDTAHDSVLSADLFMEGIKRPDGFVKNDPLTSDSVKEFSRFAEGEFPRTLVFVNACRTGEAGNSIAGTSGFAEAFLWPDKQRGAAAFVGALWKIHDAQAYDFAETFYDAMVNKGDRLIDAANKARKKLRENPTDFTWLAYTIYGNPMARIVRN